MRVAVVGPGALGCLFASLLTEGGLEVVLVDHRPERAARLLREGIHIQDARGGPARRLRPRATADVLEVGTVDLVMVCTKAQDTPAAAAGLGALVGPDTQVWSVQNGLGNLETLVTAVGEGRALGGTTAQAACWDRDGALLHAGEGPTRVGEPRPAVEPGPRARAVAVALGSAGLPIEAVADVRREIWAKLLVNASLNPVTALARVPNGALCERPGLWQAAEALLDEALQVAAAQGYTFSRAEALARLEEVARRTATNRSSMLADVLAGRPTEVDALSGALARLGPAPLHALVAGLLRGMQAPPRA
jgi:2-dehydropantoate 2-reductase